MTDAIFPAFLLPAVVVLLMTPVVRAAARRLGVLDHPNARKPHAISTPRLGGISIALAWAGGLSLLAAFGPAATADPLRQAPLLEIVVAGIMVFGVGLADDIRPLSPGVKILVQLLAATIIAGAGIQVERVTTFGTTWHLGSLSIAATVIWLLSITNAFNLIDGLDGLATGLAIIAGATCTAIVWIRGDVTTAVILVALLGALVGFLPYNFNPASIFLGDSGSLLAGFVLAVTAVTGFQKGATALAVGAPILIFALPIADSMSTIVRRIRYAGEGAAPTAFERILQADLDHIHHRLLRTGLSQRATVLVLYALAMCLAGVALLFIDRP
jgi:UDP-GlcNAc:undecaprenyl-phosphate GlcNAc-1-phosphate transferase